MSSVLRGVEARNRSNNKSLYLRALVGKSWQRDGQIQRGVKVFSEAQVRGVPGGRVHVVLDHISYRIMPQYELLLILGSRCTRDSVLSSLDWTASSIHLHASVATLW